MFLFAIGGVWFLDEVSFGCRWEKLLVPFLTWSNIGDRRFDHGWPKPFTSLQEQHFFLFFCPLPVWFSTVKRSLLTILDLHPLPGRCEVYQNSLLGEMLASNGGRALVFVEGGNATKTMELGFLWTGLGSEVKGKHTLDWNPLILEPQWFVRTAIFWDGSWNYEKGASSAARILTTLFSFCQRSSYFC